MSRMQQIIERGRGALIQNYSRLPVSMDRGEGAWLWDADGKRYLDLFAGFGAAILGHCHPELIAAATEQAGRLWHVGNTFYTEPQITLAERLQSIAFEGSAFFCHSGAEANEAAVKLARLRGQGIDPRRWKIISLQRSFHGRTLAMISATGNPAVKAGFGPEVPGFLQVECGDAGALERAIDDETAGILMEPIQGEGGINFHPPGYAAAVRKMCDQRKLTLIFDEVWTGFGRTGKWFGYQHLLDAGGRAVIPDLMTMGKAAGGGLPVGIMFARSEVAAMLVPGKHGSTLGANPICMAVSNAIITVIQRDGLLDRARELGDHAITRLKSERRLDGIVADVRGRGLFLGIELARPPEKIVEKALDRGLVINLTAQKVIRLAPAMTISAKEWDQGLDILTDLLSQA